MLLLSIALASVPPPLVNATPTDDYPEVVLLRHTTADGSVAFICTGTLVAPDAVLTAAHCLTDVDGYNLTDVRVYSGAVWSQSAPERQASDWLIHPDYFVSNDGLTIVADLGVVYLDEPYAMQGYPLNADPVTAADVGTPLRYVGWGSSSDSANDQGYTKRVAEIPISGLEGEFVLAYDGENGSATCGGDSGAPAFELQGGVATSIVAVHSFGRDDDGTICAGSTSGDTRVDLYLDWIVANTGALTDAEDPSDTGDRPSSKDDDEQGGGCGLVSSSGVAACLAAGLLVIGRRTRADITPAAAP